MKKKNILLGASSQQISGKNSESKFILFYFFFFSFGVWRRFQNSFSLTVTIVNCVELFWGYSPAGTVIYITSGSAQNDVLLRTVVYSPTSRYVIFEPSFMLLSCPLMYHFIVLCQGWPTSCGVHIQCIFSQRSISTHFRAIRPQCCRMWIH